VHGGQIVKYALQLILLHAIADHDKLLEEQQDVGPNGQDVLLGRTRSICWQKGKTKKGHGCSIFEEIFFKDFS